MCINFPNGVINSTLLVSEARPEKNIDIFNHATEGKNNTDKYRIEKI